MSTSHIQTLRAMLREEKGVILPGAPNALAARIIADLGFKAVYLTGAGLTNMHLGLPDLGFIDLRQVTDHVMAIRCVIEPHRTSEFRSTLLAIAGRDLRHPLQVIQCAHEYLGGGVRKTSDLNKLRSGRGAIDQFRDQLDELVAALQLHVYIGGGKLTFASGGQ
jgi:hypothetical protein